MRASSLLLLGATIGLALSARATDLFDPTAPDASWDDSSPVAQDLDGLPVWDRVDRLVDPDTVVRVIEVVGSRVLVQEVN